MMYAFRFPFLFPALDKEYVAWKTLDAILTNETVVLLPRIMYFLHFMRRLVHCRTVPLLNITNSLELCSHCMYTQ